MDLKLVKNAGLMILVNDILCFSTEQVCRVEHASPQQSAIATQPLFIICIIVPPTGLGPLVVGTVQIYNDKTAPALKSLLSQCKTIDNRYVHQADGESTRKQ